MLKRLKNNIGLKILSVLIAILFWFIVYTNENPIETRQIDINLTPLNESYLAAGNLRILNDYADTVAVTVRGRKSQVESVSAGDFLAYLDFEAVEDENTEYIEVSGLSYIGDENISYTLEGSGRVGITVDRIVAGEVPIKVELSGEPAEGFVVAATTVKPAKYTILEIKSLVQDVAEAVVYVNVDGMKGTETVRKYCVVYDSSGESITELSNQMAVDITVGIAKEVPVEIAIEGEPAEDHLVTAKEVTPDTALVQGSEEDLGNISKVVTLPVNVEGVDETFTVTTGLAALPVGTGYVGSGEAVVQITVEGLFEKTVTLRKSDIEIRWGLPDSRKSYEIQNDTVEVRIKGRQSVLDIVNAANLSPYIDVSQQPDGLISVPLRFDGLSGVEQTNFPLVDVLIQSKRSINLQTDQIYIENRSGGLYNYSFNNTEVVLELKGDGAALDQVAEQNLNPSVDVDGLGAGTHTVEIKVNLPEGVETAGPFTTVISIANKE